LAKDSLEQGGFINALFGSHFFKPLYHLKGQLERNLLVAKLWPAAVPALFDFHFSALSLH
jgi:hypothetical protein